MVRRMRYRTMVLLPLLLAACAEPRQSATPDTSAPELAAIVCEPDGTTTMPAGEVAVKPDGLHLVVENRLGEAASLNGLGMDVNPGVSECTLSVPPGDYDLACWPFSRHESGTEPETIRLRVLDPESLYVPGPKLDCEAWSAHGDLASPSQGIADDPIEAARRARGGGPGDRPDVGLSGGRRRGQGDRGRVS